MDLKKGDIIKFKQHGYDSDYLRKEGDTVSKGWEMRHVGVILNVESQPESFLPRTAPPSLPSPPLLSPPPPPPPRSSPPRIPSPPARHAGDDKYRIVFFNHIYGVVNKMSARQARYRAGWEIERLTSNEEALLKEKIKKTIVNGICEEMPIEEYYNYISWVKDYLPSKYQSLLPEDDDTGVTVDSDTLISKIGKHKGKLALVATAGVTSIAHHQDIFGGKKKKSKRKSKRKKKSKKRKSNRKRTRKYKK